MQRAQVSPTELESLLLEIQGVADVAVVGVPDALAGELPKAFIVRKPGHDSLSADEVQNFLTPKVSSQPPLIVRSGRCTASDALGF